MKLLGTKIVDAVLFSPLEGHVLLNGSPASGAEITRIIKLQGEEYSEEKFKADSHGHFKLPLVREELELTPLNQFLASQRIFVQYKDEEYLIWNFGKMDTDIHSELGGSPIDLTCNLTDELRRVETPRGGLMTICHWRELKEHR